MKKMILPFVLGVMMISCSRDNDNTEISPNPINSAETPVLVTGINVDGEDDDIRTSIKYNGNKIQEWTVTNSAGIQTDRMVFQYEGDLIKSIENTEADGDKVTWTFTYKGDKLDNSVNVYTGKNSKGEELKTTTTRSYVYNDNNNQVVVSQNKKSVNLSNSSYNSENNETFTYILSDGLITRIVRNPSNGVSEDINEIIYDGRKSPFKNITGVGNLVIEWYNFVRHGVFQNMLKEEVVTTVKYGLSPKTYRNDYAYEYNSDNYPTKQVQKMLFEGKEEITTTTYTYNK